MKNSLRRVGQIDEPPNFWAPGDLTPLTRPLNDDESGKDGHRLVLVLHAAKSAFHIQP